MSAIVEASGPTGFTLYFRVRNPATNQIWNGSAFENFSAGNWSTYANTMTEEGATGSYTGTFPSSIAAGKDNETVYPRVGGSPPIGDTKRAGPSAIEGEGTGEISVFSMPSQTDARPRGK